MQPILLNTVGQSLMAIGLYTVAFESVVLTMREQMLGHLSKHDSASLTAFEESNRTANGTIRFCKPRLLAASVLDSADFDSMEAIRHRRNVMAHEGYDETFTLSVADIEVDVQVLWGIARKVERWGKALRPHVEGGTPMRVAPSIFGIYLEVARTLARTSLAIPTADVPAQPNT